MPIPKSLKGEIKSSGDSTLKVLIGNTSTDDFNTYINDCSNAGFNIKSSRNDRKYSASNSDDYNLSLEYEGLNIMSIYLSKPYSSSKSVSSSTVSKPSSVTQSSSSVTQFSSTPQPSNIPQVANENKTGEIRKEFKDAMDSYENFMNEYVSFMKKYEANPSDISLLSSYATYMSKYADFVKDFSNWEGKTVNSAEETYYIDVQARVTKKLLEVSQ